MKMSELRFGELVVFDSEYRTCKTETINVADMNTDEVVAEMVRLGIECLEDIICKEVHKLKQEKYGVFLGTENINIAYYYDFYCDTYTERYTAHKSRFIEVAEIRCEGIKKTYYVPLENVRLRT